MFEIKGTLQAEQPKKSGKSSGRDGQTEEGALKF